MQTRLGFEREINTLLGGFAAAAASKVSSLAGTTLYLPIRMSTGTLSKVGVYLPSRLRATGPVTVIVYLHGNIDPCTAPADRGKFERDGIEAYWNTARFRCLREALEASGVPAILVAPTLSKRFGHKASPSGDRANLDQDGRFDFLLDQTFDALKTRRALPAVATVGDVVLAGHSAGGRVMQEILAAKNRHGANVVECWGYECLYFGTGILGRWLKANPAKRLRHYRRPTTFPEATKVLKALPNFIDIPDGADHCGIVKQSWGRAIAAWSGRGRTTASVTPKPVPIVPRAAPAGAGTGGFTLIAGTLESGSITVATAGNKKAKTEVLIRVAPAVFLPEIVGAAQQLALKAGDSTLAAALDRNTWFKRFTRTTFLGRELKKGQYLHLELARRLKAIEAAMVSMFAGTAKTVGDELLLGRTDRMSGSRLISKTATFSMHMFGLAVDINYIGNPYIHTKTQISELNRVLRNAAQLSNTAALEYRKGSSFDAIQRCDTVLEQYFAMATNPADLRLRLPASTGQWRSKPSRGGMSTAWSSLTVEAAARCIEDDITTLGTLVARGGNLAEFRARAILDFDKRFVTEMQRHGMNWGGSYGDMMHFDMRSAGVGVYIQRARLQYKANANALARRLYGEKRYGPHTPASSLAGP
jgi:hypothetical protein